jgi:hypothetical protein
MNEREKIQQAEYCLAQLAQGQDNLEEFKYKLSAFLSPGRTVLQYALNEAKKKDQTAGRAWYDQRLAQSVVLRFFRDMRNLDIHEKPVPVHKASEVGISASLHFRASLAFVMRGPSGEVVSEGSSPDQENPVPTAPGEVVVKHRFKFAAWRGPEDILSLCAIYLNELKAFVADGQTKGWLTG